MDSLPIDMSLVLGLSLVLFALIWIWHVFGLTPLKMTKGANVHAVSSEKIQSQVADDTTALSLPPDPDPLSDFDLETATMRNFVYVNKTVRYPYYQTMAHQPMHINHWIEIDKEYQWYLSEKARVIEEKGRKVIDSLPENDEACGELLQILVDYLPKRYPTLFERTNETSILNKVTNEHLTGLDKKTGVDALLAISRLVQDDFLMARQRDDGKIYLVGGLIAFPGFYLLSETIGKPIEVLHDPVPYFNEKLLTSVQRTLTKLRPDQPFERSSWNIVDDRNLFWHNLSSGVPHESVHPKDLWLRIDHQTFRKLPHSRAIIFGVHPVLQRLEDLAESPLVPALLEKVHIDSDKKIMDYKGAPKYSSLILPYLRKLTQRQLERGIIKPEDDVKMFREALNGAEIPTKQSPLSLPTESEIRRADLERATEIET